MELLKKITSLMDELSLPAIDYIKAEAYHYLSVAFGFINLFAEAEAAHKKTILLSESIGWKGLVATTSIDLAILYLKLDKLSEAKQHLIEALSIAKQNGDLGTEAFARSVIGKLSLEMKSFQKAVSELRRAVQLSNLIHAQWNTDIMHADLAIAFMGAGDIKLAYEHAENAVNYGESNHRKYGLGYALNSLGLIEMNDKRLELAIQHLNQSINLFEALQNDYQLAQVQRNLAQALIHKGNRQEALKLLQSSNKRFEDLGLKHEVEKTNHFIEEIA